MLSQTTSSKSRDRDGTGTELAVRPVVWARSAENTGFPEGLRQRAIARAARSLPQLVMASDMSGTPGRRVCLGCMSWKCTSPRSCAVTVAAMVLRPCVTCRGMGAVRIDGPACGFVDCEPCDGLGLVELAQDAESDGCLLAAVA